MLKSWAQYWVALRATAAAETLYPNSRFATSILRRKCRLVGGHDGRPNDQLHCSLSDGLDLQCWSLLPQSCVQAISSQGSAEQSQWGMKAGSSRSQQAHQPMSSP